MPPIQYPRQQTRPWAGRELPGNQGKTSGTWDDLPRESTEVARDDAAAWSSPAALFCDSAFKDFY